jgi:hypothetical protein
LQRRIGVQHTSESELAQLLVRQLRRLATDHNVGKLRPGQLPDCGDLFRLGRRFDKADVGAGFAEGMGAIHRGGKALDRNGVGACDDYQVGIGAGIDSGLDLSNHFQGRYHLFAFEMSATFGKHLILNLDGVGAGAFEQLDGAPHVECVAKAGVCIDHQRADKHLTNGAQVLDEFGQCDEAIVGDAEEGVGDAGASDVGGRKSTISHHPRGERIGHARQDQGCAGFEHGTEQVAGGLRHRRRMVPEQPARLKGSTPPTRWFCAARRRGGRWRHRAADSCG